jgi:hypothetical protein
MELPSFISLGQQEYDPPMNARLTWQDEYFGRAIGIRSATAKLRLVLLDLVFIILNSADLALAFNVLYDSEAGCLKDNNSDDVHFHSPR